MGQQSATMAMVDHTLKSDKFKSLSKEYNKIRVIEPLITSDVKNVTKDLKTSLSGLKFSVKTASSTEDKLSRNEKYFSRKTRSFLQKTDYINLKTLSDIQKYAIMKTLHKSPKEQLT